MSGYFIRRLLLIIPTVFLLTLLVFFSVRFIPGDIVALMMREARWTGVGTVDRASIEKQLGLDKPAYEQYGIWIGNIVLRGDFGKSMHGQWTVSEKIFGRMGLTFQLGIMTMVIGMAIALPVGIYSAVRQDTAADYIGRTIAILGMSTPAFWIALMILIYPAIWWGWSPPLEWVPFAKNPLGSVKVLIIPSIILGAAESANLMRLTRSMMLEVLRQDYIRTAWSKGLTEKAVILRHGVKNAFIPIVTMLGTPLGLLIGGSVIMETIFNLPGLGQLAIQSLTRRDYPVVQAVNLIFSVIIMLNILLTDMIYPFLDPRIRYT